ncbi:hypothetical protein BKA00_002514 [Actinomadura coerulea]|uniref:Uncharacterized protein n=1 Tax=Actinomadura coerulea TaxID=46159 RepID=A0A7X0FXJ9_9ACTN|nr:hypothetical protein [Actinomadura coerulea]MBB6395600.1 hypothetical protein [Actinomadura coerulea]GGQ25209.1 hypothetical protein GCM10010187_47040 [Actinomadura coerulea]
MIVIVSGSGRRPARPLLRGLGGARLLTPRALAGPGTRCDPADLPAATLGTRWGTLAAGDVTAVLACLPAVTPWDLPHIAGPERSFVAAELTALLALWLQAPALVVNRPVPGSLCGRGLDPGDVRWAAVEAGLPVAARSRAETRLTLVGDRILPGGADPAAAELVRTLAKALDATVLCVRLAREPDHGWSVHGVEPWWQAADRQVTAALDALIAEGAR